MKGRLVRYSLLQEIDQGQTLPKGGQDWSLCIRPGGQAGERQGGHEIHRHHEGFGKGRRCNRKQRRSGRDRCNRKRGGRQTPTVPANPNRFSRSYSEFRTGETGSETRFLATGNHYGVHLEKNVLALDWSKPKCAGCGNESEVTPGGVMFARTLSEVSINCPK